jgi:hypothetical protein
MSKHILLLPKDLLRVIDEFLMPSKETVRALFDIVLSDLMFALDPNLSMSEIFAFIKFGLEAPVLRRQCGYYSQYHYLDWTASNSTVVDMEPRPLLRLYPSKLEFQPAPL